MGTKQRPHSTLHIPLLLSLLSLLLKEAGEHVAAGFAEDAAVGFGLVVEAGILEKLKEAVDGAGFGVRGAVDDERYSRKQNGAGAHRARFKGDVQSAVGQAPIADTGGGLRDGDHLGVGGRVAQLLALIVGRSNDASVANDDRTDGNFFLGFGGGGFYNRPLHEKFVQFGRPLRKGMNHEST